MAEPLVATHDPLRRAAPLTSTRAMRWAVEAFTALTAMVTATTLAAVALRIWRGDLRVPLLYHGDALLNQSLIKAILEDGWYGANDRLGAPFGQQLYDFPVASGNNLHAGVIAVIGWFTSDSGLVMNLFFLLSFPLAALSAFLVLRHLALSRPAAFVCSVLFALAPYHFLRGEGQLFLAAYYTVPLACYLVLSVLTDRTLVRNRRSGQLRALSATTVATAVMCLLVASASIYYAGFTAILLLTTGAVASIARRVLRPVVTALALAAVILAGTVANLAPSLLYRIHHGTNTAVTARWPGEIELYGLKLADLVFPLQGHRIGALAQVTSRYHDNTPLPGEFSAALGTVGAIGFLALLLAYVVIALRPARRPPGLFTAAGAAVMIAFLLATIGGFSSVIGYVLSAQLRAWNRMSIFILFFALLAVGLMLEALRDRFRWSGRTLTVAAAVLVAAGFLDQTNAATIPDYRGVTTEYRSDAAFATLLEHTLEPGDAVFELPFLSFPEAGNSLVGGRLSAGMGDYAQLRLYLHSAGLRWSYGSMRGRPQDWAFALQGASTPGTVAAVKAAGFGGILVNRNGYYDHGRGIEAELRLIIGAQPLVSEDGGFSFYGLRAYQPRFAALFSPEQIAALGDITLHPLLLEYGDDFWAVEKRSSIRLRWAKQPVAEVRLVNPSNRGRTVRFHAVLGTGEATPQPLEVRGPQGEFSPVQVDTNGTKFVHTFHLRPGVNVIRFDASRATPFRPGLPDPRPALYFRIERVEVEDVTYGKAAPRDLGFARLFVVRTDDDFPR